MNTTEHIGFAENLFSYSNGHGLSSTVTNENLFRHDSSVIRSRSIHALMEQPVNNYLKSQEEIEAEFCFVINSRKTAYNDNHERSNTYAQLLRNTDGYINFHNLDETLSGYMEENY
ncbi:MAG: hypothetical protein H7Y42_11205 [Chitinophagaceae bacterium]|nr:hypothetical protein [Chitinophagaceae bacterium]